MKRSPFIVVNFILLVIIFPFASFPVPQFTSQHIQSLSQTPGRWRLDKVTVNDSGLNNQPTWTVSHSDGFLASAVPFVIHSDAGGDTTGTWEGTNTWDAPAMFLDPGGANSTTVAATDHCTAVNGNSSSHHETVLYVDSKLIGKATARSQCNQGEGSDSKTLSWVMEAGSYDQQRVGVTVVADIGVTQVSYTYEYVWDSQDPGQLANPTEPATVTPTTPAERQITVTGYDGSGTLHTPLTYLIQATENGKPLAHEPVYFRFFGDVQCLADGYGIWDAANQKWIPVENVNLAVDESQQATTDEKGQVIIRGLLDFGRMRSFGKTLPCTETLRAAVGKQSGDTTNLVTSEAAVTIQYPVFVTNVYFLAANDPLNSPSRWTPVGMIATEYAKYTADRDPISGGPGYLSWGWIMERVKIDSQVVQLPAYDRDFFYPVKTDSDLIIDMCNGSGSPYNAVMQPEDGAAVKVMWMDGTQAMIAARNQDSAEGCMMWARFGMNKNADLQTNTKIGWTRFLIGQVGDVVVKSSAVLVTSFFVGPTAGLVAGWAIEAYQFHGDLGELYDLGRGDHRVIIIRSEAALSAAKDGTMTLYTFEGSPAVVDDQGKEIVAAPGEAIDFQTTGPVNAPEKRDPGERVLALQALIQKEPGITASTHAEQGLVRAAQQIQPTQQNDPSSTSSGLWIFLCLCFGAVFLLGVVLLVVALVIWRSRSNRRRMPGFR